MRTAGLVVCLCVLVVGVGATAATATATATATASPTRVPRVAVQQPGHVTVLNNERLPVDTRGNPLLTGEASVLWSPDELAWYAYFNNWGSCGDVNCCNATFGCACCCFRVLQGDCVYADGHVVVVYRTTDFATWEYLGEALPLANRKPGIVFRPTVVYNAATKMYIMWYEDRWTGQTGYAVATSRRPEGPFETIADTVNMTTPYKIGDFDIMVDTDGVAYHVRTGLVVEELNADYTGVTGQFYYFAPPQPSEGPSMFKRRGTYYILAGANCCACIGGTSVYVYTSPGPLGPYTFRGEVAANLTDGHVYDIHSRYNWVTHAQGSDVVEIPAADGSGETTYLWLGNQWDTSLQPGRPRHHDLLYWWPMSFDGSGMVQHFEHKATVEVVV